MEPLLLGGKYKVRFLRASGHNVFLNWSTQNLVLYVCLKTPYLTYIVDSLALSSQPAAT